MQQQTVNSDYNFPAGKIGQSLNFEIYHLVNGEYAITRINGGIDDWLEFSELELLQLTEQLAVLFKHFD